MKRLPLFLLLAAVAGMFAGCGHVDVAGPSDPSRVLTGTVNARISLLPPPDAELVVRLVQPAAITAAPTAASDDLVIGQRGAREQPAQVVAEQVIHAPASFPAAFRIEFRADDTTLRKGLNLEARLSWGGRVRFRNVDAMAVTLPPSGGAELSPQTIWLDQVQ